MAPSLVYRLSTQYKEIMNLLERSQKEAGCFLWQNIGATRKTADFKFKEINLDKMLDKMQLQIEVTSPLLDLSNDSPIFLKTPVKEAAFKAELIDMKGTTLTLELPTEVALIEVRKSPRHAFYEEDAKVVEITYPESDDPQFSKKGLLFTVANISKEGLCLSMTPAQAAKIPMGGYLQLITLGDQRLLTSISGTVVHKMPYEKKGQLGKKSLVKIGIQLGQPIPHGLFETFLYVERMIAFNDPNLMKDRGFRDKIHLKMKSTIARLQERPILKALFAKLDLKREENRYLKNHMDLLCELTCHIGKEIGWVMENSIEKLVYVSFMHDVGYFDNPKLAKIKNKASFELMKGELSPDEQATFLKGPAYVSELAKQDDGCAPDAHKILLQHRERPDGTGFPINLKSSQLAPLSCLFMVCHEFSEYMLSDPDWTYETFIKQNNRVFKGPYFYKIFEVFERLRAQEAQV